MKTCPVLKAIDCKQISPIEDSIQLPRQAAN